MGFLAAIPAAYYAVAGIATAVIGTAVSVEASKRSAEAQQQAQDYNAQVATNNQKIADQYADAATQQGNVLAQQKQMAIGQQEGAIKAAVGGAGLDPGSGSPLRLSADTQAMGNLDVATIRANAAKAAYGYHVQGLGYGAQAGLDLAGAKNAAASGNLSATGDIINSASSVSSKWAGYRQSGLIGGGTTNGLSDDNAAFMQS